MNRLQLQELKHPLREAQLPSALTQGLELPEEVYLKISGLLKGTFTERHSSSLTTSIYSPSPIQLQTVTAAHVLVHNVNLLILL